ncbi:hypothetical protein ACTL6U_21220 [Rhodovibrionaceae bacterium A322]
MKRKASRRPVQVSRQRQTEICSRIAAGETLRAICAAADHPSRTTVLKKLCDDPVFFQRYEAARTLQAELWAEEILEIADDLSSTSALAESPRDELQRARLRVEVRKWLLARLTADQAALARAESTTIGADSGAGEENLDFSDLNEAERDALRAILEGRLGSSSKRSGGAGQD